MNLSIPNTFTNGYPADATQVNSDFAAVATVVNGNIGDSNIASNAAIQPSKISGTALTQTGTLPNIGTVNMVWNPFLYGTVGSPPSLTGWTVNTNATLTLNDTGVTSGVNSVSDSNAADTWVLWQTLGTSLNGSATSNADINLVPGKQYVVSADVNTASGGNTVYIRVQNGNTFTSGGTDIQTSVIYHPGNGAYSKIYSVFTVPASSQNICFALAKAANTTSVKVSDFSLQRGSYPTPIFGNAHILPSGKYAFEYNTTLTGSQLSASAGILGSQLASNAGILGSQLVNNPVWNGQPKLASGYQASGVWGTTGYAGAASQAIGSMLQLQIQLTNALTGITWTPYQTPSNVSSGPVLQFLSVYGAHTYVVSSASGGIYYQASYVGQGN